MSPYALRRLVLLASTALLATACARGVPDLGEDPADDPTDSGAPAPFVVHEWGTFTSMQGSTGDTLEGLHHTEERLPDFVHGRDRLHWGSHKSIEALPEGVTQKLETPVLYFYGDGVEKVSVEVDFPQGVIGEWYPDATSWGPALDQLDRIADGTMRWDVELLRDPVTLPPVPPEDIWAPSRAVDALSLTNGAENERFIFYRGLGRFELPIRVSSDLTTLTIQNLGDAPIPAVFLIHVHPGGGAIVPLGALQPGGVLTASPSPKEFDLETYMDEAASQVEAALIGTGLYADEARAMVDTWRISYFGTPGLRLLYVVPRAWTDALLPIRVSPAPDELVRTLVGRVEVLAASEEAALAARLSDPNPPSLDELADTEGARRLLEPKLRRMLQLLDDPRAQAHVEQLIAALQPDPWLAP